ncbi:hypothetical protein [Halomicrobium urmianum]|uniref:hypothetical protein n=1 Tax=Halomicrobium urmianum TaxID=1586233 RepID=UPI001CD9BB55|nr:hypothetical protein [Halomicrobium urmianum]
MDPPEPDRWDAAAVAGVALLLAVGYVLVPRPAVQYAVWLAVFCIWMAWFVFYGTKWLYGVEA